MGGERDQKKFQKGKKTKKVFEEKEVLMRIASCRSREPGKQNTLCIDGLQPLLFFYLSSN